MDEDKFKAYDAISNWCSMLIKKNRGPFSWLVCYWV